MKEKEIIYDISAELEREFGPKGSGSRKAAEDKAWEEYRIAAAMRLAVELRPMGQ